MQIYIGIEGNILHIETDAQIKGVVVENLEGNEMWRADVVETKSQTDCSWK